MENKLQELTKKLYDEGLSKGRHDAETMLADAREQAKKIVADAWAEAGRIKGDAEARAEDLRKNTLTEIGLAGKQVVGRLKEAIGGMVVARSVNGSVAQAAMDPAFIREVLVAVAKNWQGAAEERVTLKALLPEAMKAKLDKAFEESVRGSLDSGLDIAFSDGVKSGFRIGPKDGGYYISFTDESFEALLGEYLRPKVNEVLYGAVK